MHWAMPERPAAPPETAGPSKAFNDLLDVRPPCPWCDSADTEVASPFGGTVSEILCRCRSCGEGFGWMKWDEGAQEEL